MPERLLVGTMSRCSRVGAADRPRDINAHLLALMDIKADEAILEEDDVGGEAEEDS